MHLHSFITGPCLPGAYFIPALLLVCTPAVFTVLFPMETKLPRL